MCLSFPGPPPTPPGLDRSRSTPPSCSRWGRCRRDPGASRPAARGRRPGLLHQVRMALPGCAHDLLRWPPARADGTGGQRLQAALGGERIANSAFDASRQVAETAQEKACRLNPGSPKLRRESGLRREIPAVVSISESQARAAKPWRNLALLGGLGHGGEWFDGGRLERAKGFEPSTPTLARLCSTPELRPRSIRRSRA